MLGRWVDRIRRCIAERVAPSDVKLVTAKPRATVRLRVWRAATGKYDDEVVVEGEVQDGERSNAGR